jgi:hypothetical protein
LLQVSVTIALALFPAVNVKTATEEQSLTAEASLPVEDEAEE